MIVLRLFLSIIVITLLANVECLSLFIILSVLNSILNVGIETSISTISLLLPEDKISKYTQMIMAVHGADYILAAIILAITMEFITVPQLFYGCAVFYGLLFIFSLKCILNKESHLLSKQMELFDEEFYVEKKKIISMNKSNKFRRRSSIEAEIEKYFQQKQKENEDIADINVEFQKRIDFPIYEKQATLIYGRSMKEQNNNKNNLILTKNDWILICLSMLLNCMERISTEIASKWFTLYVIIRFNESIAISNLMIAMGGIGAICGIISFGYFKNNICKRLIYGKDRDKLNKKEDIIITACCSITNIFVAIFVILWMDPFIPYLNYAWCVAFISGWISSGITAVVPNLIIVALNTEHLEAKILAIKTSLGRISASLSSLIIGFLWTLSINWFLNLLIISSLLTTLVSLLIIGVSLRLKVHGTRNTENPQVDD